MPLYDCTIILNPQHEESELDAKISHIRSMIEALGGNIKNENRMGVRRLAYEVKKLTQGLYVSLVFEASPAMVKEMERQFRFDDMVLRYLTCLYGEDTGAAERERRREAREARETRDDDDRSNRRARAAREMGAEGEKADRTPTEEITTRAADSESSTED